MGADSVERDPDGRMITGALLTAPMYLPGIASSCTECKSTDLEGKHQDNGGVHQDDGGGVREMCCLISHRLIPHLEARSIDADAALDAGAEAVDKP